MGWSIAVDTILAAGLAARYGRRVITHYRNVLERRERIAAQRDLGHGDDR